MLHQFWEDFTDEAIPMIHHIYSQLNVSICNILYFDILLTLHNPSFTTTLVLSSAPSHQEARQKRQLRKLRSDSEGSSFQGRASEGEFIGTVGAIETEPS